MAYNRYGRMKKPIFRLGNPDAGLEIELARCRAMHHVHDAAGILTEAMHYADPACSRSYTSVVEGLSTLACPRGTQMLCAGNGP
jgi:hypothetical protein